MIGCDLYHATLILTYLCVQETSLDFHPKNSNWSHFEGYTIPSPTARVNDHDVLSPVGENPENTTKHGNTSEEEDGEDFLWSEPPSSGFKDAAIHIRNTFTRMVGGGGDDAAEAAAEDSDIRCSLQPVSYTHLTLPTN